MNFENSSVVKHLDPKCLDFTLFRTIDIKNLSVCKIITPLSFNIMGHVFKGGLYDPLLGPTIADSEPCQTCGNGITKCTGHFGHMDLPLPVVNPLFHTVLCKIMKITCLKCFTFQKPKESPIMTDDINTQLHSFIGVALRQCVVGKVCINCSEAIRKVTIIKNRIMISKPPSKTSNNDSSIIPRTETVILMPDQSRDYMRNIWKNESDMLKIMVPCLSNIDLEYPTDIFFFEVIPVVPPIARPVNYLKGQIIEHPQSQIYKSILQDSLILKNIIQIIQDGDTSKLTNEGRLLFERIRGNDAIEKLHNAWQALQANVDHLMDRDMSKTMESANCLGLKQVIEKKEGIIRMHMMGKRVNFAARSVITPDPNLNIDEIGIPEAFALKLTYPVPVTPWNVTELRQMIINGPGKHPGAVMIEGEDGLVKRIDPLSPIKREAIAKRLLTTGKDDRFFNGVKIVHRHLQNGDILLLNRQPTLHKPSIMAHKARILKGEKTLRLHYANCKAYNADFDGDEMNAHFPQNELARSEGYNIANVSNQYLVPKDGTPLGGLIQDHVVSGVRLSLRGKFFSKEDYMQYVYSGLSDHRGNIILLPPAIIKPIKLWSGKQIISTVIMNITPKDRAHINLTASSKINDKEWEVTKPRKWKCGEEFTKSKTMSEAEVIIRNGQLLCGVLDKSHYGATPYSLVHCIYELYGGGYSGKILSSFGKLFQAYLQRSGFTLGIHDILIIHENDAKRKEIISRCRQIGDEVQKAVLELPDEAEHHEVLEKIEKMQFTNKKFRALLDRKYKSVLDPYTNDINKTCLPAGLLKKFPHNNLQLMVQSGAKGSTVNTMQISCLLGQIELEGKRPPVMISGKSLPSFPAFDPTPRSGGFIDGRFMTGIQPQEFFFHCMAGREGLIDTAVKTSRSGYLQRCLIKHLEGLSVNYDLTVRDSNGNLIQIYYGEDGLDISNSRFLRKELMDFLVENRDAIMDKELIERLKNDTQFKRVMKSSKKIRKWRNKNGDNVFKTARANGFTRFSKENSKKDSLKNKRIDPLCGRSKATMSILKKWFKAEEEVKKTFNDNTDAKCPDPVIAKYRQDLEFGVLTERLENLMDDYMKTRMNNFTTSINKEQLRDLLCLKVMKTLCPPGEPVGLLAAQSIGEPSTQMTLNTFHFAGRGEMNVTLGIPRLREILMMASKNIKTPSMEIPLKKDIPNPARQANRIRLKLTKCILSDVVKSVKIDRKMVHDPYRQLNHTLTIEFLPHKCYKHEFHVNSKEVLEKTETLFFRELFKEIKKVAKLSGTLLQIQDEKKLDVNAENSMLDDDNNENDGMDNPTSMHPRPKIKSDIGELHESSDEEEATEDADATAARSLSRHQENREYDDPEDEEVIDDPANDVDDDEIKEVDGENTVVNIIEDEEKITPQMIYESEVIMKQHKKDIVAMYSYAIDYDYDTEKYHWCKFDFWLPLRMIKLDLPTIIRTVASRIVLWETPQIKRAFILQNNNQETILKTDGLNIVEMFKYNKSLDLNRLYSNDIYGVSQTYGIEAANRVILKEVKDVFKMYGITVDTRHLSLIADYMTFDGTFQPLNRKGMEDSDSPLQQMSFESSLNFLKNATLQGKRDNLESPSSRLMLGQPCRTGTGVFDVLLKTQMPTFNFKPASLVV